VRGGERKEGTREGKTKREEREKRECRISDRVLACLV